MSQNNQVLGRSTDNFTAIFNAAATEYQRIAGKGLDTHPFAAQLDTCDSPEAVSAVFRVQAQAFSKFREGEEKLMTWLGPTVCILYTFSATLGEGIGLVSCFVCSVSLFADTWFSDTLTCKDDFYWHRRSPCSSSQPSFLLLSSICLTFNSQAVKDVVTSRDTLMHLFERIHFFLQRLKGYTQILLTDEFIELLGKVMAQLLSILALSTKAMTDRRISE